MSSCKDCVHYVPCLDWATVLFGADTQFPYKAEKCEDLCDHFKPKSRFVEVVRCKDCKSYNTNSCADGFGWCEEMDCGKMDNFYCSFGEKALKERESK